MTFDAIIAEIERLLDLLRKDVDPPPHEFLSPVPEVEVKVAFVIGHTSRAKGANSPYIGSEWDFHQSEAVKKALAKAAKDHGVDARFLTFDPSLPGYHNRCRALAAEINAFDPDYVVELHFNSFHSPSAHGTETLHTGTKGSLALAGMLQACTVDCLGTVSRSVPLVHVKSTRQRGGGLIRRVRAPAALPEFGFGSNPSDAAKMEKNWPTLAVDLIKGLKRIKAG